MHSRFRGKRKLIVGTRDGLPHFSSDLTLRSAYVMFWHGVPVYERYSRSGNCVGFLECVDVDACAANAEQWVLQGVEMDAQKRGRG